MAQAPPQEPSYSKKDIGKTTAKATAIGATVGSAVPVVGTAIGAGVGALAGLGIGAAQYFKGKKQMEELESQVPDYEATEMTIPEEAYNREALALQQQMANQGIPEQQRPLHIQN